MQYIDVDLLRKEIKKRLKNVRDYMNGTGMKYKGSKYFKAQGKESAYDALLSTIDSLQQEQLDFPTTDEQVKEFLATHHKIEVPEKYKNPDFLFKKQEQPKEDWREKRKKECPFRRNLDNNLYGCERYADVIYACDGNCSWVVDYPKLKEIQDKKEQKSAEWKPQPESLEALMYAIEGRWDMIPPTSYLSRRLEDLYEGLVNTYRVDESLVTELHKAALEEDIEALKELKRKIDASMEKPVEKHTEWSEADENKLNHILEIVHIASGREASVDEKEELESFLKSLKPQRR